jgi:hypothetical protein
VHAETGREDECETEPDARRGVREAGHRQVATRVQVSGWQRRDSPSSHACKHILRGDLGVSTSTRKRLVLPERPSVLHEASARGSNRFDLRGAMVLERRRLKTVARERTPSAGIDAVRAPVDEFKTTYTHRSACS